MWLSPLVVMPVSVRRYVEVDARSRFGGWPIPRAVRAALRVWDKDTPTKDREELGDAIEHEGQKVVGRSSSCLCTEVDCLTDTNSQVIIPIIAAALANHFRLTRVVVLKPLARQMFRLAPLAA
jgi:hypothetical protein